MHIFRTSPTRAIAGPVSTSQFVWVTAYESKSRSKSEPFPKLSINTRVNSCASVTKVNYPSKLIPTTVREGVLLFCSTKFWL